MERQFFAQLNDDNIVIDVHVVTQEFIDTNLDRYTGVWVETFYDTAGKTYAGIDMIYDYDTQNFVGQPPIEPIDEL